MELGVSDMDSDELQNQISSEEIEKNDARILKEKKKAFLKDLKQNLDLLTYCTIIFVFLLDSSLLTLITRSLLQFLLSRPIPKDLVSTPSGGNRSGRNTSTSATNTTNNVNISVTVIGTSNSSSSLSGRKITINNMKMIVKGMMITMFALNLQVIVIRIFLTRNGYFENGMNIVSNYLYGSLILQIIGENLTHTKIYYIFYDIIIIFLQILKISIFYDEVEKKDVNNTKNSINSDRANNRNNNNGSDNNDHINNTENRHDNDISFSSSNSINNLLTSTIIENDLVPNYERDGYTGNISIINLKPFKVVKEIWRLRSDESDEESGDSDNDNDNDNENGNFLNNDLGFIHRRIHVPGSFV
ncbi:uncharacterized protein ASCRUDRAFT_116647 [Ascoidea rubescens DSM 1968]|uniref:DUF1746 domain-containing protein n=1 Tax=Ascoidea rubescens DSM 1968 TaxID=1344418 RepID=A0A1D2VAT4_9ASCO|nr:hypothetical protein ASCRUDRAFT_116647 [Ascoidea rubescens DSM 1968]ODV58786.1 hypothetical protein ASCRUDRAFT_116647 [Ascoidea rubescens DSM 1968]